MTDSYSYHKRAHLISSANYLNSTLQSRAYIETKLLFPSINSNDLISTSKEQDDSIIITDELIRNDQTIIDVMMDLISSIDKYRNQQKIINESITSKNNTIEELNNRVNILEKQLTIKDKKNKEYLIERNRIKNKYDQVNSINKVQHKSIKNLSNSMKDIAVKNKIDMKKKELIIDELKTKLITKRNLSSTIKYGIPLTPTLEKSQDTDIPITTSTSTSIEEILSNNIPIDDKEILLSDEILSTIKKFHDNESSIYINQLSNTINDMTSENYKLTNLIKSIENYLSLLNLNLISFKEINLDDIIPDPLEILNESIINEVTDEIIMKHFNEIENCEFLTKPVIEEFLKFYNNLRDVLVLSNLQNYTTTTA
ncbi:hypothetical protein KGF54_003065 [Candida jiufengensis]|uniref:uncharacterized protein n=1 Tax=Candida jiufengensis TaxID=497108 RepID=UPI0022246D01|nr:uncharacterized protein KGF54_003065 [Candida jiufengensis]KAI5953693.1 hypothetical protein KGF54_003065 [Candida jiufengensis]